MTLGNDLPTILFSVETASRELDSKLVTASALAARGCRVIVGHKEIVAEIARNSRRVVWQGKSLFSVKSDDHLADRLIANDSVIMFMTDEGAMHQADSWVELTLHKHWVDFFRTRRVGRLCVWGSRQRDVIVNHEPTLGGAIAVTGSARFDLCLPSYAWITEAQDGGTASRGEPFVLACTRFTAIAHGKGMAEPFRLKLDSQAWAEHLGPREIADLWFKKWRQDTHDFVEFVVLIKELAAARPDRRIVVRPHPSESLEFYRQAFATLKSVDVRREGNVLSWIRSAELVVHSNCTSGIEAVLAGRPVVNFLSSGSDRTGLDVEVAREAGITTGSIPEAMQRINCLLAGETFTYAWSDYARSILNNLTEEAVPLLVRETLALLKEEELDSSSVTLPGHAGVRTIARRLLKRGAEDAYVASKRGRLRAEHVEMVVDGCRSRGIGGGRIRHMTEKYVVIDPS